MIEINGYTRTCGLIGNPVEHTMSPAIHNTLADKMGLNLVYVPFHVPTGHVEDAVKGAYALNLLGCNVTVPYKSEVIPYLQEVDSLEEIAPKTYPSCKKVYVSWKKRTLCSLNSVR